MRKHLLDLFFTKKRQSEVSIEESKREQILKMLQSKKELELEDLPQHEEKMIKFFQSADPSSYYRLLDLTSEENEIRVVVIGDTHCDYNSVSRILEKLALSRYDYFGKAYFVFLGDYLDRGAILFEYIQLLVSMKEILKDRMIMLKGNHEMIEYDEELGEITSSVIPANTCPTLNKYCGSDKEYLRLFANYFKNLPLYLYLRTKKGNYLLVHGGIPRNCYLEGCSISSETGELLCEDCDRPYIMDNLLWSDPIELTQVMQTSDARFKFGSQDFELFITSNSIDTLIRSHEPVTNGVKPMFDNRLYTVFSTGGSDNPDTGYPDVDNPCFGIIDEDGEVEFESIYYDLMLCPTIVYNTTSTEGLISPEDIAEKHLNPEFFNIKTKDHENRDDN